MMASELLTLPEVARQLDVSLDEVLRLVKSRTIPAGRGKDGGVYVRRSDLDTYQASRATA